MKPNLCELDVQDRLRRSYIRSKHDLLPIQQPIGTIPKRTRHEEDVGIQREIVDHV